MNVLIDAMSIRRQKAGVGVYAQNLIDQLTVTGSAVQFFILAQNDDSDLDFSQRANVTMLWISAKIFRRLAFRFGFEQLVLPLILLKHRIDVLHSLHYSFPLVRFRTRQVVTLHDMTSFYLPDYHVRIKVIYFRFFIRAAVRFADAIIFVSESARRDCKAVLGNPRGLSAVIHHGKSQAFHSNLDAQQQVNIRARYFVPQQFLLYIGTIEPRKNLTVLVAAFSKLAPSYPDLSLVLAGMKGWNNEYERITTLIQELGLKDRVLMPGFIDEKDKPYLLAAATIFVYPSLYEGFGLPVLEALACGTPTVTSNTSSIPEVAGDAAVLTDPSSEPELFSALQSLLASDSYREQLRKLSIAQADKFTWHRAAELTAAVYLQVAGSSG